MMAENLLQTLEPKESSLMGLINKYKDKMLRRACDSIRKAPEEKQDAFLSRTAASIIKNDNIKECFNSNEGKVSIYMLIDSCLKTGLELDKHAYAIPYNKKINNNTWVKTASFQIKRQGFHALLCGGLKPIFQDLRWGIVFKSDMVEFDKNNEVLLKLNKEPKKFIDPLTNDVNHLKAIVEDPGKPIGAWVQAIKLNNSKEAVFYPISYIHEIRNNHSKTYQDFMGKKISSCTWLTDPIPMIEKTAIKAFCRPYADVHEELSNAYYRDDDEIIEQKRNISDIAENIIDQAVENLDIEKEVKKDIVEEKELGMQEENKKMLF